MNISDIVKLNKTLYAGIDFYSNSGQDYKEGSIGTVCEIIDENTVFVEFGEEYKDPVIAIDVNDLVKI